MAILLIPVAPLFAWIPDPNTIITGPPTIILNTLDSASFILYYLNLGPVIAWVVPFIAGMILVRIAIAVLDIIIPPIPIVGTAYQSLMSVIRRG